MASDTITIPRSEYDAMKKMIDKVDIENQSLKMKLNIKHQNIRKPTEWLVKFSNGEIANFDTNITADNIALERFRKKMQGTQALLKTGKRPRGVHVVEIVAPRTTGEQASIDVPTDAELKAARELVGKPNPTDAELKAARELVGKPNPTETELREALEMVRIAGTPKVEQLQTGNQSAPGGK